MQRKRVLWCYEAFKRHITRSAFKVKEGELQGEQFAIEEKLGIKYKFTVEEAKRLSTE